LGGGAPARRPRVAQRHAGGRNFGDSAKPRASPASRWFTQNMLRSRGSAARPWTRLAASPLFVVSFASVLYACSDDSTGDDGNGGSSGSSGTSPAGGSSGAGGSAGTGAGTGGGGSGTGGAGGSGGSAGGGTGGSSGTSGTAGVNAGGAGSSGAGAGGDAGLGANGGASGGGSSGASGSAGDAGSAGNAGTGGGGGGTCPSGVTGQPTLTGTPTRVASVPPPDAFNMDNGNFGNVEGPVWIGDALYVSEMSYMAYDSQEQNVKMSRILKVTSDGTTTIHIADSGSNGIAVDANGDMIAAVHKDGTLTRFAMPSGTPATPVASMFMNARFNSPNDLAIRSDGNIYFSDPNHQAPNTPPQSATRAYRVAPGGAITPIPNEQSPDQLGNPNGITLSLNEDFLYVAAAVGRRYPVMADGSLGAGTDFPAISSGDGMVVDCAGNLYVARDQSVSVYTPDGTSIGSIPVPEVQSVTNVAFGGADRQTLYITGLGNQKGLFTYPLNLPGKPY
jgi:gluconolactonase